MGKKKCQIFEMESARYRIYNRGPGNRWRKDKLLLVSPYWGFFTDMCYCVDALFKTCQGKVEKTALHSPLTFSNRTLHA